MAEQWPANWHKLTCPDGHELKSYSSIVWTTDLRWFVVYAVCDECGLPCAFRGTSYPTLESAPPERVILPTPDSDKSINVLPFKLPDEE